MRRPCVTFVNFQTYGIDWSAPCVTGVGEIVAVPDTPSPLSDEQYEELRQVVDPLGTCGDYGIAWYIAAREFIRNSVM
jgi:hypothetical protein